MKIKAWIKPMKEELKKHQCPRDQCAYVGCHHVRKLRQKPPSRVLLGFCSSLLSLYLVFVIGVNRTEPQAVCLIVAVLLHYLTLTTISWMGVEAYTMMVLFIKLKHTFAKSETRRFMLKARVFSWGFPALIVVISLVVNIVVDSGDFSQYLNDKFCFIRIGYTFYFTQVLFLGLVLLANAIIYGLVMHKVICGRYKSIDTSDKRKRLTEIRKIIKSALGIGLLVGMTWIFGLLALIHEDSSVVFLYLFAILNTLQGLFIFVVFCVLQPDAFAIWKKFLSIIRSQENSSQENMTQQSTCGLDISAPSMNHVTYKASEDQSVWKENEDLNIKHEQKMDLAE